MPPSHQHVNYIRQCAYIQTDRYFIDRKKVISDLFVIEMKKIYVHVYTIVNLLKSYDNIHGMTQITKIMVSGIIWH